MQFVQYKTNLCQLRQIKAILWWKTVLKSSAFDVIDNLIKIKSKRNSYG